MASGRLLWMWVVVAWVSVIEARVCGPAFNDTDCNPPYEEADVDEGSSKFSYYAIGVIVAVGIPIAVAIRCCLIRNMRKQQQRALGRHHAQNSTSGGRANQSRDGPVVFVTDVEMPSVFRNPLPSYEESVEMNSDAPPPYEEAPPPYQPGGVT